MISHVRNAEQNSYCDLGKKLFYGTALACGAVGAGTSIYFTTQNSTSNKNDWMAIAGMTGLLVVGCFGLIESFFSQKSTEMPLPTVTIQTETNPLLPLVPFEVNSEKEQTNQKLLRLESLERDLVAANQICQEICQQLSNEENKKLTVNQNLLEILKDIKTKAQTQKEELLKNQLTESLTEEISSYEDISTSEMESEFVPESFKIQISHIKNKLGFIKILLNQLNQTNLDEKLVELLESIQNLIQELNESHPPSLPPSPLKGKGSLNQSNTNSPIKISKTLKLNFK